MVRVLITETTRGEANAIGESGQAAVNHQAIRAKAIINSEDIDNPSIYDRIIIDGKTWKIFSYVDHVGILTELQLAREV